jgi:hypothetical protein
MQKPCPYPSLSRRPRWRCRKSQSTNIESHQQQQSRLKQNHQQELLRQMRPNDVAQQQYQAQMMRMQNGNMNMGLKQGNLARAAMANNQNK